MGREQIVDDSRRISLWELKSFSHFYFHFLVMPGLSWRVIKNWHVIWTHLLTEEDRLILYKLFIMEVPEES